MSTPTLSLACTDATAPKGMARCRATGVTHSARKTKSRNRRCIGMAGSPRKAEPMSALKNMTRSR
eukprot:667721-Pyramimonas_sp.AAC.1